jgi:hypothetical protein
MLTLALTAPASAQMHQIMARELARHAENDTAIANYREAIKIDPHLLGMQSSRLKPSKSLMPRWQPIPRINWPC